MLYKFDDTGNVCLVEQNGGFIIVQEVSEGSSYKPGDIFGLCKDFIIHKPDNEMDLTSLKDYKTKYPEYFL